MEAIYIVLVRANTGLGKIGRLLFSYEYTHIAVSLERDMEDFVTFSRRKHHAPFDAGFMHERREHYAFGKHKGVKVKVFKVPVTKEKKQEILRFIQEIEMDPEYVFNLYSMLTMSLLHGMPIHKAHNCMSFVGKVLQLSGAVKMEREYYRYNIEEMDALLSDYFYREGWLKKRKEDEAYMRKVGPVHNVKCFLHLNRVLITRIRKDHNFTQGE